MKEKNSAGVGNGGGGKKNSHFRNGRNNHDKFQK